MNNKFSNTAALLNSSVLLKVSFLLIFYFQDPLLVDVMNDGSVRNQWMKRIKQEKGKGKGKGIWDDMIW